MSPVRNQISNGVIIDGRIMAKEILAHAKARAETLARRPSVVAYVASNETPATRSYLKIKERSAAEAGCDFEVARSLEFPPDASAVIVQLPLPNGVDTKEICNSILIEKDADVLSTAAREKFERGDTDALLPPVVGAVKEILKFGNVEVKGKQAVVIGAGFLVGAPMATWLRQQGAEVKVLTIESSQEDLVAALAKAVIIVSGAGSPHLIKPEMIQQGLALIDAGTSESSGKIVGDADPSCAAKCSLFTPVPGGVGPIAVAMLFENAVILAERKN